MTPTTALRHGKILPWVFLIPTLVGLFVFRVGPTLSAFYTSLTRWDVRTPPEWIGFSNFSELLQSQLFWHVLRNTMLFALIFVPAVMVISFLLALAVNEPLHGVRVLRGLLFAPYITTMVAVALLWNWILATRFGIFNWILTSFGLADPPAWLADPATALPALAIVSVWKQVGFQMLLFLAALQSVPRDLYEASAIDGARKWQQVVYITLPLLRPATFFIFIITLVDAFKTFEVTYVMTGGGPNNASNTLAFAIFENAFIYGRMGFASALAVILAVVTGLITLISFAMRGRLVSYDL